MSRRQPERVVTIEAGAAELAEKKASRRVRRAGRRQREAGLTDTGGPAVRLPETAVHPSIARVAPHELNVTRESTTILNCATAGEARIISLGPLEFFSTETGDAWVLDPSDRLARCLSHN